MAILLLRKAAPSFCRAVSELKLCPQQSWFVQKKVLLVNYWKWRCGRGMTSSNYQCIDFLLISSAEGLAGRVGRALIIFYSFC